MLNNNKELDEKENEPEKSDVFKIRKNAMILGNAIYQISNISILKSIEDIPTDNIEYIDYQSNLYKCFSELVLFLVSMCVLVPFLMVNKYMYVLAITNIVLLFIAARNTVIVLRKKTPPRKKYHYELLIIFNSSEKILFSSKYRDFLERVKSVLEDIIKNREHPKSLNINMIENEITNIKDVSNSVIATGNVNGSIKNEIKGN